MTNSKTIELAKRLWDKAAPLVNNDALYLKVRYRLKMGKKLNLRNPVTFNEKLQWLKLYDRNPLYTLLVDKVKVKDWVAERIGSKYIIPTLGVWKDPDEIDFDALPNRFVLKCNHNSGMGMCICRDKSKLNVEAVKAGLREGIQQNYFLHGREWPYRDVPRRILAEQYMEDNSVGSLEDYKVMCFGGKAWCTFTCTERFSDEGLKVTFFDRDWKRLPFTRHYPSSDKSIPRPKAYDEMLRLAEQLSNGIPFARIDFYEIQGQLYFGEITFYPGSGLEEFTPETWDDRLGELIILPNGGGYIIVSERFTLLFHKPGHTTSDLRDFKFFCFGGEPRLCQVISDRSTDEKIDFYDMNWNRINGLCGLAEKAHNSINDIPRPNTFEQMKRFAAVLSQNISFVRVDFYDIRGYAYFGEMTFFPMSGLGLFRPDEWNERIGSWLTLPPRK